MADQFAQHASEIHAIEKPELRRAFEAGPGIRELIALTKKQVASSWELLAEIDRILARK